MKWMPLSHDILQHFERLGHLLALRLALGQPLLRLGHQAADLAL